MHQRSNTSLRERVELTSKESVFAVVVVSMGGWPVPAKMESNMEASATSPAAAAAHTPRSRSPSLPPSPQPPFVVVSPCAACKILRRRCVEKCVLAPYFPPSEPLKFTTAHRVFGASNIIKMLQELKEEQRADAVSSMVYEANARIRDPVYGCAGVVFQLQKQVSQLQEELAKAQAEVVGMKTQQDSLIAIVYSLTSPSYADINYYSASPPSSGGAAGFDADSPGFGATAWEPLWTSS